MRKHLCQSGGAQKARYYYSPTLLLISTKEKRTEEDFFDRENLHRDDKEATRPTASPISKEQEGPRESFYHEELKPGRETGVQTHMLLSKRQDTWPHGRRGGFEGLRRGGLRGAFRVWSRIGGDRVSGGSRIQSEGRGTSCIAVVA